MSTLLTQISQLVTLDIDSNDAAVADRHSAAVGKFCDMTSNQAIVYNELIRPENSLLVQAAIKSVRDERDWDLDNPMQNNEFLEDIIDEFVWHIKLLCALPIDMASRLSSSRKPSSLS